MSALTLWHWLALAAILATLEVILGANFIFLACALAALLTGIISWLIPSMNVEVQGLLFGLSIVFSLIISRHYLKKRKPPVSSYLNQRAHQYINRQFTLEEPIVNGRGRVKVDDTIWSVEGDDLPAGTRIQVVDADGIILKVKKSEV
jgi:membrane protein implicated in regulation of membrane protease activity